MKKNKITNASILVTGAAGFIGSHLVDRLLIFKPKRIYMLDNLSRGKLDNIKHSLNNSRLVFKKGTITNRKTVDSLMSEVDYCFHMASMSINTCRQYPNDAFNVMFRGTFNIADAATKYNIKKLIYSSSASVYGAAQDFPTPETNHPYDNKTLYGVGKLFGEGILKSYHYSYGLNYVALRYFNVYGPRMDTQGKYNAVFLKWLDRIKKNIQPIIYGDGSISMDLVYVGDVVEANIAALASNVNDEVFNVGYGTETSLKKLLLLMLTTNKSSLTPKFINIKSVNPVPRRKADISKANRLLHWQPKVKLEQGIEILSNWYLKK